MLYSRVFKLFKYFELYYVFIVHVNVFCFAFLVTIKTIVSNRFLNRICCELKHLFVNCKYINIFAFHIFFIIMKESKHYITEIKIWGVLGENFQLIYWYSFINFTLSFVFQSRVSVNYIFTKEEEKIIEWSIESNNKNLGRIVLFCR